jgi:hypothetical protein
MRVLILYCTVNGHLGSYKMLGIILTVLTEIPELAVITGKNYFNMIAKSLKF